MHDNKDQGRRRRFDGSMKKSTRDVVCVLAIGLAAMFALPVAYRVWIHYNPPTESRSFSDVLREAGGIRREALLTTPLEKWSEADAKLAPDIREWLAARSDVILPWEWSDEARKKDWKGYCDAWQRVVGEQSDALDDVIDKKTGVMEEAADMAQKMRKAAAGGAEQCTNLLAAAESQDRTRDQAKADIADLSKARDGLAAAHEEIAEAAVRGYAADWPESAVRRRLLEAIAAAYRYRMPGRRNLPRWLLRRVRKWFGAYGGGVSRRLGEV